MFFVLSEKKALTAGSFEDTAVVIDYVVLWKDKTDDEHTVATSQEESEERGRELAGEGGILVSPKANSFLCSFVYLYVLSELLGDMSNVQ